MHGPNVEAIENVAFQLLVLVGLIVAAALLARRVPDLRTLAVVLGSLALVHLAVFSSVLPRGVIHSQWNWNGKVLSIAVTLLLIAMIPSLSWSEAGFRWNQHGTTVRALVAAALVCTFSWSVDLLVPHPHVAPTAQAIWYQALIPGPSEEPLYRGLALVLLDRAFGNRFWPVFGAPFGLGASIMSVWFGVIHGVGIAGGHIIAVWPVIAGVTLIGFGLGWIRMRTRSLIIPIITHAVVDVGDTLIG
jgi:membrane protease YdiL (CAAX protease family)